MKREEEIRARLDAILPGGWAKATPMVGGHPVEIWHAIENTTICRIANTEDKVANADFIYMAPEDIDYLLKENQRLQQSIADWISGEQGRNLREENQRLRGVVEVLRDNMVQALAYTAQCPECERLLPSHADDCELQRAMKRESQ